MDERIIEPKGSDWKGYLVAIVWTVLWILGPLLCAIALTRTEPPKIEQPKVQFKFKVPPPQSH